MSKPVAPKDGENERSGSCVVFKVLAEDARLRSHYSTRLAISVKSNGQQTREGERSSRVLPGNDFYTECQSASPSKQVTAKVERVSCEDYQLLLTIVCFDSR